MKYTTQGNCPYCDSELGYHSCWSGSDEMFGDFKKKHKAGHPENKPTKECKLNNDLVYKTENLDTILQEADKDFEDFYWETGKYNGRDLGIDGYKDFIHSQITKAYELGQEGYLRETPLKEIIKNIKDEGKNQTINQIKEWANSVSFNGLIDKDVLIQFLSKTK